MKAIALYARYGEKCKREYKSFKEALSGLRWGNELGEMYPLGIICGDVLYVDGGRWSIYSSKDKEENGIDIAKKFGIKFKKIKTVDMFCEPKSNSLDK